MEVKKDGTIDTDTELSKKVIEHLYALVEIVKESNKTIPEGCKMFLMFKEPDSEIDKELKQFTGFHVMGAGKVENFTEMLCNAAKKDNHFKLGIIEAGIILLMDL